MTRIRVWAEFLPFGELKSLRGLELLSEFGVGFNVAVYHDADFAQIAALLDTYLLSSVIYPLFFGFRPIL